MKTSLPALLGLCLSLVFGASKPARWAETQHLLLGPDQNACGVTVPIPAKRHGIILWLHGGMRSQNPAKGWDAHRALLPFLKPGSYYLCSPSAHAGADWMGPAGMAHIDTLLDYMAKHYPVRMDSFVLVGVSDGCLGALNYARLGKYKPLHFVLFSVAPTLVVDPRDLQTVPAYSASRWDIFQGGHDRLFPAEAVFPVLQAWAQANPKVKLHLYPDGEHDFSWYIDHATPEIKALF